MNGGDPQNPFLGALSRLAQVPIRAAQLPFQLVGDILNTPRAEAQRRAAETQRTLAENVTGEEVPFSRGRHYANLFSLGLIPGNPSAAVDESQLGPEQSQRFEQLTPRQQALLQAKTPQDYANLVQNDQFFAEERQPGTLPGQVRREEEQGFITAQQAQQMLDTTDAQRRQREEQAAGLVESGEFEPESVQSFTQTGDFSQLRFRDEPGDDLFDNPSLVNNLVDKVTPESLDRARETGRFADLEFTEQGVKDAFEQISKTNGVRNAFLQVTKPARELGDQFRGLIGAYGQNQVNVPPDIQRALTDFGVDLGGLSSDGFRDIALIFQFMKVLDPESTVRESEGQLVVDSAGLGDPLRRAIEQALNSGPKGEFFSPAARDRIFRSISDVAENKLKGYQIAVEEFGGIAQQAGVPENLIAPDLLRDVTGFFDSLAGREKGPKQAERGGTAFDALAQELGRAPTQEEMQRRAEELGFGRE